MTLAIAKLMSIVALGTAQNCPLFRTHQQLKEASGTEARPMLIRIEDPAIGSIEIATRDDAGMQQQLDAITRAISIFSCRYDGRDNYDFLSLLYDQIKQLRNPDDGPAPLV